MAMTTKQKLIKRGFDFSVALIGLVVTWPAIAVAILLVRVTTGDPGIFRQVRLGVGGRRFTILKVRTMQLGAEEGGTVTVAADPRISPIGQFLRRTKIDELPQLWNVLVGDMSLVGPRPDVPEKMSKLCGRDRVILSVRPGITGPATLKYRYEEVLLQGFCDPIAVDEEVIFPDKIRLNIEYIDQYTFAKDLYYLVSTAFGLGPTVSGQEFEDLVRVAGFGSKDIGESRKADVAA
jgi:lipopolysaccharide/colanic/teichoic acid biosynthesis glycosyltransferase